MKTSRKTTAEPKTAPERDMLAIIDRLLTEPGIASEAYTRFYNYSAGNQMELIQQLLWERRADIGPVATYGRWQEMGRQVRKGEKALGIWMPVQGHATRKDEAGEDVRVSFTRFMYKTCLFAVGQTDPIEGWAGAEPIETLPPTWDADIALANLDITRRPFDLVDGNVMGYATKREIAISPVASDPIGTTLHEIAHIVLGHTDHDAQMEDGAIRRRDLKEFQAETTAAIVKAMLGITSGEVYSAGYVQSWIGQNRDRTQDTAIADAIPGILKAVTAILKAGAVPA